jgi:hypothetical protein
MTFTSPSGIICHNANDQMSRIDGRWMGVALTYGDLAHLQTLRVLADGADQRMIGGHKAEAALGDLMDALLRKVFSRVTRKLARLRTDVTDKPSRCGVRSVRGTCVECH